MKALFTEIRRGDVAAVSARLERDPALMDAVAVGPPKKDDGKSALQVAITSGQFAVARLLVEHGADIDAIDRSTVNRWNVPVLHDAIRAAIMSTRFGRDRALPGEPPRIEILNTRERSDEAFALLELLVAGGADPDAMDSFGNPALSRAVLDAHQVIDEPILPELDHDLRRIFDLLIGAGADPAWIDPRTGSTLADSFADEPVRRYLPSDD